MKRLWPYILLIFLSVPVTAQHDSLFMQAGKAYDEGAYEEALDLYRVILEDGVEAPDLYYNMGNAAFRSNNIGYAVLYFEKALKMDPGHADAAHNLEYVSRYKVDAFDQVPEFFLRTWMRKAVHAIPEKAWSTLALALFLLTLLSLVLYLFTRSLALKKTGFFMTLIGLILFIFTFFSARAAHSNIVDPQQGIVVSPSVTVRSTPSESGTSLFILHEGTRIDIQEDVSGWQNIRIIDGREGWIRAEDFEKI